MTDNLERALRDEFVGLAQAVPSPPDVVDIVIARAKRTRRRRRVASGAAACLVLVAGGLFGVKFAWTTPNDTFGIPGGDATDSLDRPDDFSQIAFTDESTEILTPEGTAFDTGLVTIVEANEVSGGWLLGGLAEGSDEEIVRYIGYDGEWTDLATDGAIAFPNETGEMAVVEYHGPNTKGATAEMYAFTGDASVSLVEKIELPKGFTVTGMSTQYAWLSNVEDKEAATITSTYLWAPEQDLAPLASGEYTFLEPLSGERVLADRVDNDTKTFCPAVVYLDSDSFMSTTDDQCYADLAVEGSAISQGGQEALVFVRDLNDGTGEWVSLSFLHGESGSLVGTGYTDLSQVPLIQAGGELDGRFQFPCCLERPEEGIGWAGSGYIPRRGP